ncbi:MAG: PQQ-binding-like beta-propeller repeat protein [Bdellovibrionaceae bacterium]|nr:PQQ-binding-like beta-propeller repeat protein [Pseudobdellovibrionaceae bacterium]
MKALISFLLLLSGFLVGCSTMENLFSKNSEKRELQVRDVWVREGTLKENLGFRKINRMSPLILGEALIQSNAIDGIAAYNKDSGQTLWRLNIQNGSEAGAAIIKDRLFFGASDGLFYSVSAKDGKVLWTFPTNTENISEPLLDTSTGVVYFQSGANIVYALDAESGRQIWLYSRQDNSNLSIRGGARPTLDNGHLYVGFSDGALVKLNAKTGSLLWELVLNRNKKFRDIDASPVIDGDQMFVSGYDDKLYCVSVAKGEILWKMDRGGYYPVTIAGEKIFYSTTTGELWALQKSSGQKIWTYTLKDGIATQPKIYKGMVVFGETQGELRFLDANSGKAVASFDPGRGIMSPPLVDEKNDRVYFISGEANVYAIEAKWSYPNWIPYLQ